jgi:P27 family predicted phage terminase small subunit
VSDRKPSAPTGLGAQGRAFWRVVVDTWTLTKPELSILERHCQLIDEIDGLSAQLEADGLMIKGSKGQPVAHPAVASRLSVALAARLLGQLRLPDAAGASLPSPTSIAAQRAAQARWAGHVKRGRRGAVKAA